MKSKLLAAILLVISGCASNPVISRAPGEALFVGEENPPLKIMIRTIDDGPVLWIGEYKLGTNAFVKPGQHKINVICEIKYSWGAKLIPGNITLDVQPGTDYKISGQLGNDEKKCNLSVSVLNN